MARGSRRLSHETLHPPPFPLLFLPLSHNAAPDLRGGVRNRDGREKLGPARDGNRRRSTMTTFTPRYFKPLLLARSLARRRCFGCDDDAALLRSVWVVIIARRFFFFFSRHVLMSMPPQLHGLTAVFFPLCVSSPAGGSVCSFHASVCQESARPPVSGPLHALHPAAYCPVTTGWSICMLLLSVLSGLRRLNKIKQKQNKTVFVSG